ncbi:MAG: hypothetical protein IJ092_07200 [Atopobiaceae bacterium]|nr:hypothetical protein [Atopobiaceae bacterium]
MPLLLSHNSSLERLRSIPRQVDSAVRTAGDVYLQSVVPKARELSTLDPSTLGISQRPIHHLIPSSVRRRQTAGAKSHLCQIEKIPRGLLLDLGEERYAAGPELTFIQMANQTSLIGSVVLGHELCGTYSQFACFASGFYERPALTSVEGIDRAIGSLKQAGLRGTSAARRALRWVRDGSASPMETVVSCMLHLPRSMGGFGLVAPALNYEQQLDDAAKAITGKETCRVDTAYVYELDGVPKKEGIEFDGKDYHRDTEADRVRREALAHMGWTIYVLNVDDLTSYRKIKEKVALLDDVPKQRSGGRPNDREGRLLLDRLLRATRFGVGLNAAFFGAKVPSGKVKLHL